MSTERPITASTTLAELADVWCSGAAPRTRSRPRRSGRRGRGLRLDGAYSSARRVSAARDMARIFPSALARGRYFMPQSVPMMILSGVV